MTIDLQELNATLLAANSLRTVDGDSDDSLSQTPFEGPEKLLEVWFAPCYTLVNCDEGHVEKEKCGLRSVPRQVWEDMLDIVKCKVLSVVSGKEIDAYLLSESSLFVWPHKLILKTCGRTLNLLGLPRILNIAAEHAGLTEIYQLFYSRKSFMFPEHQFGPHKDWSAEVQFLDNIFHDKGGGSAYTVGRVNGDHWLLYVAGPGTAKKSEVTAPALPMLDYTVEILMSDLSPTASKPFFYPDSDGSSSGMDPSGTGQNVSHTCGITSLFPPSLTNLDAYAFDPCGYSANALIAPVLVPASPTICDSAAAGKQGEGYYTIHVTPEEGYSYASFECNVALPCPSDVMGSSTTDKLPPSSNGIPDLVTLVQRVVEIFQPGRLTLTVFMSSSNYQDAVGDAEIEFAQKAFKAALRAVRFNGGKGEVGYYRRTDKINYEFGNYDLAFATFERKCIKA